MRQACCLATGGEQPVQSNNSSKRREHEYIWPWFQLLILEMSQEIFCWGSFLLRLFPHTKCLLCLSHRAGCTQFMYYCGKGIWSSGNHKKLGFPEWIKCKNALEEILVAGMQKVKLLGLNSAKSGMNWGNEGRRSLPSKSGMMYFETTPFNGCRY